MLSPDVIDQLRVVPDKKFRLKNHDPAWRHIDEMAHLSKNDMRDVAQKIIDDSLKSLLAAQTILYASNCFSLLIILQGMDASGKDGIIAHVMSGTNPQGCEVHSFKQPSAEELDHDFLWRYAKVMPERGRIGIFNRSYYEEVLVVKVHPEWLQKQNLPTAKWGKGFWEKRYEDINHFERHLTRNGTLILKFCLHISKEEQRKRFLDRLDDPEKNWKFSGSDIVERQYWEKYQEAYESALKATSTKWAPWYVIPSDNKWMARAAVSEIVAQSIHSLDLHYPPITPERKSELDASRERLLKEKD